MVFKAIWRFLKSSALFVFWFRKVFLAIPVVVGAYLLSQYYLAELPQQVGLILSQEGFYSVMVAKETAVRWWLYLTGGSLVLMFFSRKVFYPWLISILTLFIPYLVLLLNRFI